MLKCLPWSTYTRFGILLLALMGCSNEDSLEQPIQFVSPPNFGEPTYDFSANPITSEGFALGKALFFDPILSIDSTISCASCHMQTSAFAHTGHRLSHGVFDGLTKRNAPALQNLAWTKDFSWIGGIKRLDRFAILPIEHPHEMGDKMYRVVAKLKRATRYLPMYRRAFQDTITIANTLKALSQFQLMMVSNQSKYDAVSAGRDQFSTTEQRGHALFQKHCVQCHSGARFTNDAFAKNGIESINKNEQGRYEITGIAKDKNAFRVPSLRNVERTRPYMHDGQIRTLAGVIDFYANSSSLKIKLSDQDQLDLVAFLKTLTDYTFINHEMFKN